MHQITSKSKVLIVSLILSWLITFLFAGLYFFTPDGVQVRSSLSNSSHQSYLVDNQEISNNTYKGSASVKAELAEKIVNYNEIRNFHAEDYSLAQTKGDIIPNYEHFLTINFATESGGLKGVANTKYIIDGKEILQSYTTPKDGKLYLNAKFLATFLSKENLANFLKDLKKHNMTLNSFVSARIEHGSHTFDNMDPNLFSSYVYAEKLRRELDTLNYEEIVKIDDNTYELVNSNNKELPLVVGYQVIRYRTLLKFTSDTSFTLERYGNKLLYFKISYDNKPSFTPMPLPVADIDNLDYKDNFISPDVTMR